MTPKDDLHRRLAATHLAEDVAGALTAATSGPSEAGR